MARRTQWRRGRLTKPIMTYLEPEQRRGLEAVCERDDLPMAVWLRRLIVAELSRQAMRDRLEQNNP